MSDKTVYSFQDEGEDLLITGLTRAGDHRWRVTLRRTLAADEAPPRDLARDLAAAPLDVAWLLRNHEVQIGAAALPPLKAKELKPAVAGWIAREEKGAPEDYLFAWRELSGAGAAARRDLVLTYTERQTVQPRLDRAEAWDVKPGRVLSGFMALDGFFRVAGPCAEGPEVWNLVFVGENANFLCVGSQDAVLMTRPLPADLSDGADQDEYMERLATEVSRSLFFARQSAGSPEVQRIVVCGHAELTPRLAERLRDEQSLPVDHWDLGAHFDPDGHEIGADAYPGLAAAALGGVVGAPNLLREPRRGPLGPKARRRLLVGAVALAATITPLLWYGGVTLSDLQDDYLHDARRQLRQASRDAREAERVYREFGLMRERGELMVRHRESTPELDRLLLDLAAVTPVQITFDDLRVTTEDERLRLTVVGQSRDRSAARAQQALMDFITSLERSELLGVGGEPRRLEIDRPEDPGSDLKRVVFSLDYELQAASEEEEG